MLVFLNRKILIPILAGVALACAAAFFLPWNDSKGATLTAEAEKALAEKEYKTLSLLIRKHAKELGHFQGALAQGLIRERSLEEPVFTKVLDDLQNKSPLHARVSHITLLIAKGENQHALDESLRLEEDFKLQPATRSLLQPGAVTRAYNLLRIAELHHAMGHAFEEADAWQQFEETAGWNKSKAPHIADAQQEAFYLLETGFKEEGIDLREYVHLRKQLAAG